MGVHIVAHPILEETLATLRDPATGPAAFRAAMARAGGILFLEATRDLPAEAGSVATPLGRAPARRVRAEGITLVPVLRAGLAMLEGVQPLVPGARVVHVG